MTVDDLDDPTTRAILAQIVSLGFAVMIRDNGCQMTAIHSENGERVAVTETDSYKAACNLAELVGIDLKDG